VEWPPEKWLADDPEAEIEREKDRQAQKPNGHDGWTGPDLDYVRERVSLDFWCERELPPIDPLLGEFVTTTSRILLSGPTGIGKTNILMAATMPVADGADFLHWRGCGQPRRVLYLDGEMSRRLFKARLEDTARRHGNRPGGFFALNREDFEDMPPLDTADGQRYIDHIIAALSPDIIVLDNIMSLTAGDLREPESWRKIAPWTRELTRRQIGQIWVHHTGIATDRGYGDSTREWGLDTVALLEKVERPELDICFKLSFTKARERRPDNRADFDQTIITLANDRWTSERGGHVRTTKRTATDRVLELLREAINREGTVPAPNSHIPPNTRCVTEGLWRRYCDAGTVSEGSDEPAKKAEATRKAFQRATQKLIGTSVGKWELWVWIIR
jgi:hypothetical protein